MSDTIQDRAERVVEGARQRTRELIEFLRQKTGTRKLATRTIPVRSDK